MDITLKPENIETVAKIFQKIGMNMENKKKLVRDVIIPSALVVKKEMKSLAPVMKTDVWKYYRTPKLKSGMKAPKGKGKVVYTMPKGQMKNSIDVFQTAKSKRFPGVNIAPQFKKGKWKKPELGGWYLNMLQHGTPTTTPQPFVIQALQNSYGRIKVMMEKDMFELLKKVIRSSDSGYIIMGV
mgnify:FL=1|tara:strand:- start:5630 stop:6178 length:549 start_codon:yes stop_codon:yes gene_type:complete